LIDLLGYRRFAAMMVEGQFLRAARTRRIAKGER
jgi:hypothetical protein